MNKSYRFFAVSFVALCACAPVVAAQNAPTFMSKYGEIQSVNKYSSNPFWSPDSPYNQRFPTPIYATGPDVNTGDCNRIVQNLITEYCASRGDCANARISDVRPHIMVSLSQLPGHNFATSCGGYIDTIFESYQKTYGNSSTGIVNIVPIQNKMAAPSIQIENPFKQTKSAAEIAMDARTAELENLQKKTTAPAMVTPAAFPKTIDDLSFTDRMANTSAGYEPYKDLKSYKTPKFETEDEYYERMKSVLEHSIHYVGAGAANTGCPTKYLTGRGATISCRPTIENGTCTAWCTDVSLTKCQNKYTIAPSENTDKTFYGKCTCNPGYVLNGNKCAKPGDPVNPDPTPDPTPDPVPNPENAPQCLIKMSNDAAFKSKLATDLAGVTDLNKWIGTNKNGFYTFVADYVIKYCLKGSASDITEFNTLLDSSTTVPVYINFNGSEMGIGIDKTELFDYATYWTYPIVINNSGTQNIGTTLSKSATSLPNFMGKCTGSFYTSKANGPSGGWRNWTIESAARPVYPASRGNGFLLGDISFPGMLYNFHQTFGVSGTLTKTKNYALAREQIKKFADAVNADGGCAGNNMIIYLVSEPAPDENKATTVKIISEPFFIR